MGGANRRDVTPDDPLVAAWGHPAIVLRCGVGEPPIDVSGQNGDVGVDGVDWRPIPDAGGYTFTTVGRVAFVEVRVPKAYAPEVNPLVDLAPAIARWVPR